MGRKNLDKIGGRKDDPMESGRFQFRYDQATLRALNQHTNRSKFIRDAIQHYHVCRDNVMTENIALKKVLSKLRKGESIYFGKEDRKIIQDFLEE